MIRIGLALTLLLGAVPASAIWYEARSRHFIVYSEGTPQSVRKFAADLERFDQALRTVIQLPNIERDDPNPVTVFAVDGVNAVKALCKSESEKAAKGCREVVGFYRSRVSGSAAFVPRRASTGPYDITAQTILFHAYAYHLMDANFGAAYPAWYRAGFAEFVSNVNLDEEGEVQIGHPASVRIPSLYQDVGIPMRRLLVTNPSSLSSDEKRAFDGRAWLAVHYLAFSSERHGQMNTYLKAINTGASAAAAAATAFGDLHQLDLEMSGYRKRGRFTYLRIRVPAISDDAIKVAQLASGDAAMMPVRIQLDRGVDDDSVLEVSAQARTIGLAYPDDPQAQDILAKAEFDAGHLDAADAAADRALSKAPSDMTAMIYKARILLHRAESGVRSGSAPWNEARKWLGKANEVQPDAAWPLYLFYMSYRMQGQKPKQNAVDALERAFALTPQDDSVRMTLVEHYMEVKNFGAARAVLAPIAFNPHVGPDHPAIKLLAQIDAWEKTDKPTTDVPALPEAK